MARIFLLLAVIVGLIWWVRTRIAASRPHDGPARPQPPAGGGTPQEAMVQCAQCGLHLPQSEAIGYRGLHYCRTSHLPRTPDTVDPPDSLDSSDPAKGGRKP